MKLPIPDGKENGFDHLMNSQKSILVVEDDQRLANLIRDYLQQQGYTVYIEKRGDSAPQRIGAINPDLVILDLMLPGLDGLTVCQLVRREYSGLILILTAREDDMDQVAGLEMGADDYVKKPVLPRVLLARIRALFRLAEKKGSGMALDKTELKTGQIDELIFGDLILRKATFFVQLKGREIPMSTHEFNLLWILAENCDVVMARENLYLQLRGFEYDGMDRYIDVMISRLRKKLEDDPVRPKKIKTVWGVGYLFVKNAW